MSSWILAPKPVEVPQDHANPNPETPYVEVYEPGVRPSKKHLCLCFLFDMRVGTIAINVFNFVLKSVLLLLSSGRSVDFFSLIMSAFAIVGALNFEWMTTACAGLGHTFVFVAHIIDRLNPFGICLDLLIVYPTVWMARETYAGIMAKESYDEYIEPTIRKNVSSGIEAVERKWSALGIDDDDSDERNDRVKV